jgi:4-amino-4-deoxy-L-arabinose transferase-like glycosyltransferase
MNSRPARYSLALMVLCLLIAAALRYPELQIIPPGVHYDEAANGILAGDIGLRGERPLFISSYTGKEVLFFYLAGAIMRLAGESVYSLRLTAAYVGILTIAATYWLGREMLADRRQALLAAAFLAVSFWHVLFSRLGFRAITEPLLQALAVAALFRGLRRQDNRWLIAAGVLLGLTAYTYLAARVFPILILFGLLPLFISGEARRLRLRQVGLFIGAAFLTLLPLLVYFARHPDAFWVRIGQVAPSATPGSMPLTIWRSLLESWGMFFLRGDPFLRFNLPGRPLFGWIVGALLVVGWLICLWRWRRFPYDWQRAAISVLIFAPLIMILPTALATNELVPSNLRAIGLIPFIYYLPAIGLVILFADLEKRFGFPPLPAAVLVAFLLILLSGGLATAQAYFLDWAGNPELLYETDGDLSAVSEFLDQYDSDNLTVYIAAPHYRHPTIAFLNDKYESLKWLPQSRALVFPSQGPSLYIYPHNSPQPSWTAELLEGATLLKLTGTRFPEDVFTASLLETAPDIDMPNPLNARFGGAATLLGYEIPTPAEAGSDLDLRLYWHVDELPTADYQPFVQLEDMMGYRWSQVEAYAYPAEQWQPGETIIQQVSVPVPSGTPPGEYQLRVGLFDQTTGERAPRLDEAGNYASDAVILTGVPILAGPVPKNLPAPPFLLNESTAPNLELLGYERGSHQVFSGDSWGLAFWWLASSPLRSLSIKLDLLDDAGSILTLLETQPVYNTYPFETWQTPQFVIDRQIVTIPVELPSGDYRLQMRLTDEKGGSIYTTGLGPLQVVATERLFTPPPLDQEVGATFGDEIILLGYNLSPVVNSEAELELIWRALQAPTADYIVFVHLLNPDGTCCTWQQDTMPGSGTYATGRWLPDEVVVDEYKIILPGDLPPGDYPIEIGLYIAETGQRLGVQSAADVTSDALLLQPLTLP